MLSRNKKRSQDLSIPNLAQGFGFAGREGISETREFSKMHQVGFCQDCDTGMEWLCRLCEMNKVESEHNFIFECSYYSDLKNQFPDQLTKDRDRHPVKHMCSFLSFSDPAVQTQLAMFLCKALEKRIPI